MLIGLLVLPSTSPKKRPSGLTKTASNWESASSMLSASNPSTFKASRTAASNTVPCSYKRLRRSPSCCICVSSRCRCVWRPSIFLITLVSSLLKRTSSLSRNSGFCTHSGGGVLSELARSAASISNRQAIRFWPKTLSSSSQITSSSSYSSVSSLSRYWSGGRRINFPISVEMIAPTDFWPVLVVSVVPGNGSEKYTWYGESIPYSLQ